jgi:hypothetical protein
VTLAVAALGLVATPAPVSASVGGAESPVPQAIRGPDLSTRALSGVWDPDDVEGRFDIRWIGAAYTSTGEIHLSLSFYEAFRARALARYGHVTGRNDGYGYVNVTLSSSIDYGHFLRRPGGRIVFVWGDSASSCCAIDRVTRPSSKVLSVTFDPCSYVYGNEIEQVQGDSLWRTRHVRAHDSTELIHLSHPECDTAA